VNLVISHDLFVCKPLDKPQSTNISISSNGIIEFDPHSILILLDCLFIIGLQMIQESQEPQNFKEFECPEKTDHGVGLYGFRPMF